MARLIVLLDVQCVRGVLLLLLGAVLALGCVGKDTATGDVESVAGGSASYLSDDAEEGSEEGAAAHDERRASAGVCSRCHVAQVLEWSVSKHAKVRTTCKRCHGPSVGHVANERNEVKPDRLPRGEAIAGLCSKCHEDGCPETLATATCQECHHVHALLDFSKPLVEDDTFEVFLSRQKEFRGCMEKGDGLVKLEKWKAAGLVFREALEILPGNDEARRCVKMCGYRLRGTMPGFDPVGELDELIGLPPRVKVSGLGLTMALIPSGEFDLGDDLFEASQPVHTVEVDAFYLGVYEVTQAQWQKVVGANPSAHQGDSFGDSALLPVERVSWEDSQAFVEKLNEQVPGGGFRLPTETEWEYACRAGAGLSQDPEELLVRACYDANSLREQPEPGDSPPISSFSPCPVGTKTPNSWGLFDMQGNVSEWCANALRPYLVDSSDVGKSAAPANLRVLRGGAYMDGPEGLHPAMRHGERPYRRLRWNGLRLARSIPD